MGVKFDNSIVHDFGHPQTLEEAFRVYGSWANIHDYLFDNDIEEDIFEVSQSVEDSWSNYEIIATKTSTDVLLEFDIDQDLTGDGFGVISAWDADEDTGYIAGVDASGDVFLGTYNGSTVTNIWKRTPTVPVASGHFQFTMSQRTFSSDNADIWLVFGLWCNNALVDSWLVQLDEPIQYAPSIGFAYYGADTELTVTNLRMPQLTQFVEWNSLDPGEPTIGGLQRSIEGRYLKFHIRHNGGLRAWKSKPISSTRTFSDLDDVYVRGRSYDKRQLYSHVRLLGAYTQAEYVSGRLVKEVGHRFTEVNNPYVMTKDDCYQEAKDHIRRMSEQALVEEIISPFTPLIEIEDRITTSDGERIVTTRSLQFQPGHVEQQLSARKYGYPDA